MIRRASTYLLVIVLLGCPLICLSKATAATPGPDRCVHVCCKCQQPDENRPNDRDSDRRSKDCVCGGAVAEGLPRKSTLHEEPVVPYGIAPVSRAVDTTAHLDASTSAQPSRSAVPLSGRLILALLERLQL